MKEVVAKKSAAKAKDGGSPSKLIDGRIKELGDWRGETLSRIRALIKEADPDVLEEWKWRGVPVWEHDGIICTGETYKEVVKLTFAKGAALADPAGLFNASLDGNVRRAIDIRGGEKVNEKALKALIRAAVELNAAKKKRGKKKRDELKIGYAAALSVPSPLVRRGFFLDGGNAPPPARHSGLATATARRALRAHATAAAIGRGLTTYSRKTLSLASTSISATS